MRWTADLDRRPHVSPQPESLGLDLYGDLCFQDALNQVLALGQPGTQLVQRAFLGGCFLDGLFSVKLAIDLAYLAAELPGLPDRL